MGPRKISAESLFDGRTGRSEFPEFRMPTSCALPGFKATYVDSADSRTACFQPFKLSQFVEAV